jgi:hypothetical protein
MPDTKWRYKADYLEFCSCAEGCPCNFGGFPTNEYCRAVVAYRFNEGSCGDVDLAGSSIVVALSWPKAIHEGNGTAAIFFDPSVSEAQRGALASIFGGAYGGMPHEIFSATLTNVLGPFVEPIELNVNGTKSSVKVGKKVTAEMTTHVSPVDPTIEQEVHVVIPTGFVFQDAQAARSVLQDVNVDGMTFADAKTNAFYAAVEHSN